MNTFRKSFFVTGTDTDVGKTLVSCAILRAAAAAGRTTIGMKPLAAGGTQTAEGLRNDDALQLQAASTMALPYDQVNPVCLPLPTSPHIAATLAERKVRVERLVGFCRGVLALRADLTLIEGAGGWRVPLNDTETLADLAIAMAAPVVLVVGLCLGCLNHALLSAEAIQADGLRLAGWVANGIDPAMHCRDENIATLQRRLAAPLLGVLPWLDAPDPRALRLQLPDGFQ